MTVHWARRQRVLWIAGFCAVIAATAITAFAPEVIPPCLFYAVTGLYCPGCGSGRLAQALLHGDIALAFRANPLALLLAPLLAFYLAYSFCRSALRLPLRDLPLPRNTGWVVLGMIVIYGILRNIPAYPFTLLAPLGEPPRLFFAHAA